MAFEPGGPREPSPTNPWPSSGRRLPTPGRSSSSWDAALAESRWPARGRNVVIHEFAHKIDMGDGYLDGTPPLRGDALSRWTAMIDDEYGHTAARPSDRVLGSYAWTNPAEFFAVATERFFCRPAVLAEAKPVLYEALSAFYRQDPAHRQDPARSGSDRASPDGPRPDQRS